MRNVRIIYIYIYIYIYGHKFCYLKHSIGFDKEGLCYNVYHLYDLECIINFFNQLTVGRQCYADALLEINVYQTYMLRERGNGVSF